MLRAAAVGVPGDFNSDGRVDSGDPNLPLGAWGGPTSPPPTGWTGPLGAPTIDNDDLNDLLRNWGFGTGAGTAVPEPSTAALLVALPLVSAAGRRRRS